MSATKPVMVSLYENVLCRNHVLDGELSLHVTMGAGDRENKASLSASLFLRREGQKPVALYRLFLTDLSTKRMLFHIKEIKRVAEKCITADNVEAFIANPWQVTNGETMHYYLEGQKNEN